MHFFWICSVLIIYGTRPVTGANTTVKTPAVTDCSSPSITNGIVQFSNSTFIGSVATFICKKQYYISGTCEQNTTSQCLAGGKWSVPTPSCISKGNGVSFNISKNPFIEESNDNIVMMCYSTFDLSKITVHQIELRRKLPTKSAWDTIATLNSTNILAPNLSNNLAMKSNIVGNYSSGANLKLTVNELFLDCDDVSLYQCYISYTTDEGQCYGEINKQFNGFFFPKNVSLEGKKNGVSLGSSSITYPAQLKLGDTLELNCTAQIGNDNKRTISWESSTSLSDGALLPGGPNGETTPGTVGNYHDCQYTRSATINHIIDTTDLSTGNRSFSCLVHIETPDGLYTRDFKADNELHVEIYSTCPRPPPPAHGSIVLKGGTRENSTAYLTCEPGYSRSTGFATCTRSGKWDVAMICNPSGCKKIAAPLHGSILNKNSTLINDTAEITCDDGYHLNGRNISVCQANGTWSNTDSTCVTGCEKLPSLTNGIITLSNFTNINSTASFSCYYGYEMRGNGTSTCKDGGWDHLPPTCIAIKCPNPLPPANGLVSLNNGSTRVNSSVTFSCYPGYKLVGTVTTECILNATWQGITPSCIVQNCLFPSVPDNGYIRNMTSYAVNSTAVMSCNAGYNLTGNDTIQCMENATWSTLSAVCSLIECPFLQRFVNGRLNISSTNRYVNSTAEIVCDLGYILDGSLSVECQENGTWDISSAICIPKNCSSPPVPENGYIRIITSYTVNSTAVMSCNAGYNLTGSDTIQCMENATWSPLSAVCSPLECPLLQALVHGRLNISSTNRHVNDTAEVVCDFGYVLDGSSIVECQENGTWDISPAICIPKNCTYPLAPKNGYVRSTTGLSMNSTAVIACNVGYNLTGNGTIKCTENATWSTLSAHCSLIECSAQLSLAHGLLNISLGNRYVNNSASVLCDLGYVVGDSTMSATCTQNGTWDISSILCIAKNCSSPQVPKNGHIRTITNHAVNSTAVMSCNPGYNLTGNDTIQCMENATWSPLSAVCSLLECPLLLALAHGRLNISSTNRHVNDTAEVVCDLGYVLDGSSTAECQENGTWDISPAICIPKNCTYPLAPENGYVSSTTGLSMNSTAVIACNVGYNLTGNGTIKCTENATWSTLSAHCTLIECSSQLSLAHGSLNISLGNRYVNNSASVRCDLGYVLGDSTMSAICTQNGTWDISSIYCIPKNCTQPTPPENGFITSRTGLSVNSTAVMSCNKGYYLTGNNKTKCTYNATWSPLSANCSLIECSSPPLLVHGMLNISNDHRNVNDSATVVCDPGYEIKGSLTAVCTEDGTWDTALTTCIPTNCSMPVKPLNSVVQVIDGSAVNSTAIVTCHEGYDWTGETEIICLENGLWSDINGTCAIKECKSPQAPRNGSVTTSARSIFNSTAFFKCDVGYYLHGMNSSTCSSDGNWTSEAPLCLPTDCTNPLAPGNGYVSSTTGTSMGSTAVIACNAGYNLTGNDTIQCRENATWSSLSAHCTLIECSFLPLLEHGMLNISNGHRNVNDSATVVCDPGYEIDGPQTAVCTEDGTWDTALTTCSPRNCGVWTYTNSSWAELSFVTYSSNTTFRSTAISFCREGYQINSTMRSLAATCTSNGTWSVPSPPLCVAVECPPIIETSENITIKYSNGKRNPVNSTATFECQDPDSTINGYETVTCLSSGKWTGQSPSCVKIEKHTLPCPDEKDYRGMHWNRTKPGKIGTMGCPENYAGEISRQCNEKGKWQLPDYNCVRKDIDNIDKQIEAIKENPSEEVVTEALDKLNNVTKPTEVEGGIYSGEIEKVTSILDNIAAISLSTEVTNSQAEAFLSTTSNLLDTSNTESWKTLSQEAEGGAKETHKTDGAAKILDVVSRYSDAVTASLKNSSNQTTTTVAVKNLVLHVTKIDDKSNGVTFPSKSESKIYNMTSSFHVPKQSLKGVKHVSSVLYKNLTGILPSRTISDGQEEKDNKLKINSAVVSVKIQNWEQNKDTFHINLTLGHFQGKFNNPLCNFWNESETAWDRKGCNFTPSSSSETVCECNHLTNFAILMSPWEEENVDTKAIDIISTVGCSISLAALLITIIAHIALWRYVKSDRVVILIHLSISLVISYAIFLGGVDRTENKDACTAVAVLLQYIYLVVFFLMLAEGIEISVTVLYVFTTASRLKWLLPAAWLIPAVIVGISLGATQLQGYGNEQFCWLSVEGGLIWAFVAPALTIIVVNFVLLILILRAAFGASTLAQKSKTEKTKAGVKCLCVLLPLMGCTWVIGIFYVNKDMAWIQYVFAVCNSLQGLVIFLFHCALNKQIRLAIERRRQKYASSMLSTVSSTKRFSMPRASTTSSVSDRMDMSQSISRDDASFKNKNSFERSNSERNTYEMISSRSQDSSLLQKRL
ncbi:sushi, von Willebrand factor type A, EGF and pentraxin domain-containing protein 1-like isoform X2 [Mercenaria mercenaria]|uniref:sushi, von Willebrand factor type A, EGF and pentraxin domain-containing protein 1-like isoform X2 n=1 Tax=Mercenaria mercenaria TaxID=6596 RepID=UPI00234ECE05|nr:sushi, von Willebrand factor type A, EGF and pentraxin domain-containing protein 1-like isoform X2 [Mercenaria mercenaria]